MADELITLTIDGEEVEVAPGSTIMQAAAVLGIDIPHICVHDGLTPPGVCRACVVEVEGVRTLPAACVAECRDGMQVQTRSERVQDSRRTLLELLNSAVDLSEAPEIQAMMDEVGADRERFSGSEYAKRDFPVLDDNPFYIRDYSQCVMCWRCVQACADDGQFAFALNFGERGFFSHIDTFESRPMPDTTCVFCGLCVGVCPTGALKPKVQWGMEQGMAPDDIRAMTRRGKKRREKDS